MVAKEKVVERISSITASMASTSSLGGVATSGVASVVSTGKESENLGGGVTASPAA
jgi:hypothetical protein